MEIQGAKKYLKGVLKCLVFGVFFLANSVACPFTIERPYSPELAPFIPKIEKIVNNVLAEASERLEDPEGIIRKLRALDVTLGKDPNCSADTLMWIGRGTSSVVFVCPRVVKYLQEKQNNRITSIVVAQILLHEMIHLIGYHDECFTTAIELRLMKYSPYADDVYHNEYVDECGLNN